MTSSSTFEVESNGTDVVIKNGTEYVTSGYLYETSAGSHIFGALFQESDNLLIYTKYYYDQTNGRLLAVVNRDECIGTCYTYDAIGNITSVLPARYSPDEGSYSSVITSNSVNYTYNSANLLQSITTESTEYEFYYDGFGNTDSVTIGNNEIVNYEYNLYNGKLHSINHENGFSVNYVYDKLDNIKEVWYNDNGIETKAFECHYTAYAQMSRFDNLLTGKSISYKCDDDNQLISYMEYDTDDMVNTFSSTIFYDEKSNPSSVFYSLDYYAGSTVVDSNIHYFHAFNDSDGTLKYYSVDTNTTTGRIDYSYDGFKRAEEKVYHFSVSENLSTGYTNTVNYTFVNSPWISERTSSLIETVTSKVNSYNAVTYTYAYDYNGNVTKISLSNGTEFRYVYDDLGQLTREDNRSKNYSYVYEYDNAGNITAKKKYAFTTGTLGVLQSTTNYTYGDSSWKDLLTKYGNTSITYDTIGNPLTIGENELSWEGRQLTSWYGGEYITIDYGYNADGIRTFKEVYDANTGDTTRHEYILSGSQIIKETVFVNNVESYTLVYLYDETGAPIGYRYRTPSYASGVFDGYFFEKNLQGDIIAVYSQSGTKLISYIYDAWGSASTAYLNGGSSTAAKLNPFRYRGYYYDCETGLYYLQSRYYNATWGRFISADETSYLGVGNAILSYNLFAYCANNPVMYDDPTGTFSWGKLAAIVAVTAVIAVSVVATVATFGAASVAGTIAITSAVTIAAKATEVAVLQGKKSAQDGDNTTETIDDIVNAVFDNGSDIIGLTPLTKAAGFGAGFYSQSAPFKESLELMKVDGSLRGLPSSAAGEFVNRFKNANEFLSMPTTKSSFFISYGLAVISVGNTIYSCFTSDPVARAESRGYALK